MFLFQAGLTGALIARIPPSIAQAMLAGVLLPLCLAPIEGLVENPWGVVPVVLTWLVFARLAPRWAAPLAFVTASVVVAISLVRAGSPGWLFPAGCGLRNPTATNPTATIKPTTIIPS